jgi:hypothetical protein
MFGLMALLMALAPIGANAQQAQARVVQRVDNSVLTTVRGGTPPLVGLSQDIGRVADSTPASRMLLVLKRSDDQETQLQQTLVDLHNPSSPQYHKWLTPDSFGSRFGPTTADIQAVTTWLARQGFAVRKIARGRTTIEFSGTAGQVRGAFHTEIHTYTRNGVTFHSNNQDPQIPAALAPVVAGLAALNDIRPSGLANVIGKARFNARTHVTSPEWTYPSASGHVDLATAPGDLAVQYNINPIYQAGTKGAGETIGIVSQAGLDNTVVANYRKLFGLPGNLPTVIVDGADPGTDGDGAGVEADLDVEVSGAAAPDATIYLYTGYDTLVSMGLLNAAARVVEDNTADVISVSYGICEPTLGLAGNLFFSQLWSQAAAQGQSVFVSSGDSGAAGCDNGRTSATGGVTVNGISSTPYNVSVGGTDFYYSDYADSAAALTQIAGYWNTTTSTSPIVSLLRRIPEQPWNDAFGLNYEGTSDATTAAGSGGTSSCTQGTAGTAGAPLSWFDSYTSCSGGYPKPSWQNAPGVPNDGARDIPDVSLFAANGANRSFYPICAAATDCTAADLNSTTGAVEITGVGGTSASAPLMAGIMALIDQSLHGRQGNPNFVLYALARQVPSVFHDVTVGNNNVPCTQGTPGCTLDTNGDSYYTLQEYNTGTGYDLASGLGSIDAYALLTNWPKASFSPTDTTLALSSTRFAHGAPVTVTVVVGSQGGTPTGVVSLVSTSAASTQASVGTIALSNGTGQATLNSLPAGKYTLTARYGGDGTFAASTSDPVKMNVTSESSRIEISGQYYGVTPTGDTASAAPLTDGLSSLYGSFFLIDVKVFGASSTADASDGIPTGTVTVYDNGTELTMLNLADTGTAELQTGSLTAGTHVLTFKYSGDGSFDPTTSSPYTINVSRGIPQVLISYAIPDALPTGGTLQVPVEVLTSAGQLSYGGTITVTFGSQSQTIPLTQSNLWGETSIGFGTATFDISQPGTYKLGASYSGDSNLQPVASAYNPSTVTLYTSTLARTTTTLALSSSTLNANGSLTATVTVTSSNGSVPAGDVTLFQNGNFVNLLVPLDATGTAVFPVQTVLVSNGSVQFLAVYQGDHYNSPSLSAPVLASVNLGDYSLTTSNALLTMQPGDTGTTMIAVGAPYGQRLTGPVSLQCETSSPLIDCSLSSDSLTLPNDPTLVATSLLTITARPQVAGVLPREAAGGLAGGGGILALVILAGVPLRGRRGFVTFMPALLMTMMLGGCGDGDSVSVAPSTPIAKDARTYTATITAVSSGITHTLVVKVVMR